LALTKFALHENDVVENDIVSGKSRPCVGRAMEQREESSRREIFGHACLLSSVLINQVLTKGIWVSSNSSCISCILVLCVIADPSPQALDTISLSLAQSHLQPVDPFTVQAVPSPFSMVLRYGLLDLGNRSAVDYGYRIDP
jgi:hypothetical protein